MIAANMNTTPTLVFDYDNPKLKKRKKVKIMCENYCLDLDSMPKVLQTLDGVTLAEMDLPPIKYVIKDLLPQGLAMLNGSMKIGKSWMVLDWCVRIAKGENIWNFPTTKGTTLRVRTSGTSLPRRGQPYTSVWRIPIRGCRIVCCLSRRMYRLTCISLSGV